MSTDKNHKKQPQYSKSFERSAELNSETEESYVQRGVFVGFQLSWQAKKGN